MDNISLKALAKINIGLDVTGIRDDGYHEVKMIMQTVNLFDKVSISKTADGSVTMATNLKFLPVNDVNLCIKAAKLLIDEFQDICDNEYDFVFNIKNGYQMPFALILI